MLAKDLCHLSKLKVKTLGIPYSPKIYIQTYFHPRTCIEDPDFVHTRLWHLMSNILLANKPNLDA